LLHGADLIVLMALFLVVTRTTYTETSSFDIFVNRSWVSNDAWIRRVPPAVYKGIEALNCYCNLLENKTNIVHGVYNEES
jgi:hypothetical protein